MEHFRKRPPASGGADRLSDRTGEPAVIFLGNCFELPEANLDLTRKVLPDADIRRARSRSHLRAMIESDGIDVRLLIVAESFASDLSCRFGSYRDCVGDGRVILAYQSSDRVRGVFESDIGKEVSFLPMDCSIDAWMSFVKLYCQGQSVIPRELLGTSVAGPIAPQVSQSDVMRQAGLTRREMQVLLLVTEGLKNKDISLKLSLSEHTVKLHVSNCFRKIGVENRAGAAAWFLSHGSTAL